MNARILSRKPGERILSYRSCETVIDPAGRGSQVGSHSTRLGLQPKRPWPWVRQARHLLDWVPPGILALGAQGPTGCIWEKAVPKIAVYWPYRALKMSNIMLKYIWNSMHSRCSCYNIGCMHISKDDAVSKLATAFCISCNFWIRFKGSLK